MKTWLKALAPVAVAVIIAAAPAPPGLAQHAWYFFAIFAAVVVGLVLEPLPGGAIGLIGVSVVTVLAQWVFSLLLCLTLGIMGIITPYATGPSPVYYGSGYLPSADYWRLGAIFGVIFIAVLLAIGVPWIMMLG
jgi:L-tartrate/succinate antiporter